MKLQSSFGFFSLVILCFWAFASPLQASDAPHSCQQTWAKLSKSVYSETDLREAYEFALRIRQTVADRDLNGLFGLVIGELSHGPRKKAVEGQPFDAVFSQFWRQMVLNLELPCEPLGWRGFTVGRGMIWFDQYPTGWGIFSINNAKITELRRPDVSVGWTVDSKLIFPQCFVREWVSSDNFEKLEEIFRIGSPSDFRNNTGMYLGREIQHFDPIPTDWGDDYTLVIAPEIDKCLSGEIEDGRLVKKRNPTLEVTGRIVRSSSCETGGSCSKFYYEVLGDIPAKRCQSYAPKLPAACLSAKLIAISEDGGGSIGADDSFVIYGLFQLADGRRILPPLKRFSSRNVALNYLDGIR